MSVDPIELQYVMSNGSSIADADWGGDGQPSLLTMPGSVEAAIEYGWNPARKTGKSVLPHRP